MGASTCAPAHLRAWEAGSQAKAGVGARMTLHDHYRIDAPGYERLVTHIFDPADPYIASDAVFGVKASLLAEFRPVTDPVAIADAGFGGPFLDVELDVVLSRPGGAAGAPLAGTASTGGLE